MRQLIHPFSDSATGRHSIGPGTKVRPARAYRQIAEVLAKREGTSISPAQAQQRCDAAK